ncbi:zf-TFIIB domain-containing protein [Cellulomonas sp.]|uniref:TFIIB-type zinc ribbon-containing protein n=1 Tax=Cellulomonas sp. TaxID=40001 RepID=UPI001B1434CF|nr:zf-TFIIB domain-containing protein [Cellulomonas sp.]MBO9554861.1 zf-TFIIB domain-containing protein [Cellulomonas sp.]
MRCPVDQAELVMSERQGVEIDYCPTCRGIWLDRGELDKILDRAAAPAAPAPAARPQDDRRYDDDRRGYDDRRSYDSRYDDRSRGSDPRRKKKESWLGDLFDF